MQWDEKHPFEHGKKVCLQLVVVGTEPTTHRQSGDAHDDAGTAGEDARPGEGRLNNVALVSRELMHFGPDFIRLCLGPNGHSSPVLNFLETIFELSHNDTNAATYKDFVWADSAESVEFSFRKTLHGDATYVRWDDENIFSIEKLREDSTFYQNIRGKYHYVVSFYGEFFALPKLGWDVNVFWDFFENDIRHGRVQHCVSRLDICADLKSVTVKEISDGVIVDSPRHAKTFTPFNVAWETKEPETWYYGNTSDKRWHARVYNKLVDIHKKGKEYLYPNYWGLESVTRLEIELKEVCREWGVTFLNCRDIGFLLGIFEAHLETKYVRWNILPFILSEMRRKGYDPFEVTKNIPNYDEMSGWKFYQLTLRKNLKCIERMGVPVDRYLKKLEKDIQKELTAPRDA